MPKLSGQKTAAALQKITHRIHGQRTLLVPSILLRRGYLETAHLSQIKSEMHALQGRFYQIHPRSETTYRRMRALPNYDQMTQAEKERHGHAIMDDDDALLGIMDPRMVHLKAMQKKLTQFKLN